jgi:hypothetical protein
MYKNCSFIGIGLHLGRMGRMSIQCKNRTLLYFQSLARFQHFPSHTAPQTRSCSRSAPDGKGFGSILARFRIAAQALYRLRAHRSRLLFCSPASKTYSRVPPSFAASSVSTAGGIRRMEIAPRYEKRHITSPQRRSLDSFSSCLLSQFEDWLTSYGSDAEGFDTALKLTAGRGECRD